MAKSYVNLHIYVLKNSEYCDVNQLNNMYLVLILCDIKLVTIRQAGSDDCN